MTTTCGCGRPAGDAYLCHRCTRRLERDLRDVPALVEQLDLVLARMTAYSDRAGGRAAETPLPYDPRASEAAWILRNTLTGMARLMLEQPQETLRTATEARSHPSEGDSLDPNPSTAQIAVWLLARIHRIRRHPDAPELADEIHAAITQARRIIDTPANRTTIPIGPCPEHDCPGEVRAYIPADPTATPHMTCTGPARHRYEPHQWLRAGRRILAMKERTTP